MDLAASSRPRSTVIADSARYMCNWLGAAVSPTVVSLDAPAVDAPVGTEFVSCYLYAVVPSETPRGMRPSPLRLKLLFLICPVAAETDRVHELLDLVTAAAAAEPELEFVNIAPTPDFWRALGVSPRPALTVSLPVRIERSLPVAPPVLEQLAVQTGGVRAIRGQLVSRNGIPIAAADVRLLGLGRSARTGPDGRFVIGGVPGTGEPQRFDILARGRHFQLTATPDDDHQVALMIDPVGAVNP